MTDATEQVRMEIKGILLDPTSNVPIVILRDSENHLLLPIWIGLFEANAIALRLEGVETPRPMTHDLLRSAIEQLGGTVSRVVIRDLQESTYFATIELKTPQGDMALDARPSDALALALRTGAGIFVNRQVLEKAKAAELAAEPANDEEKVRKWLEEIGPDDLGKYTM
ncbi:MAG: bifunctional nuclease family protein [Acidobacteriota bacterium]